jgi:hypothetical protein
MKRLQVACALVVAGWLAGLATGGYAQTSRVSGTIVTVNRGAGTLTVQEVGPWRVRDGVTEVTRRVLAVTPETRWLEVRRAPGAGPGGWIGEFVESARTPWSVRVGEFVTVEARRDGERGVAVSVVVVVLGS